MPITPPPKPTAPRPQLTADPHRPPLPVRPETFLTFSSSSFFANLKASPSSGGLESVFYLSIVPGGAPALSSAASPQPLPCLPPQGPPSTRLAGVFPKHTAACATPQHCPLTPPCILHDFTNCSVRRTSFLALFLKSNLKLTEKLQV